MILPKNKWHRKESLGEKDDNLVVKRVFDREMAEHEDGVPLMDATLNMMMFADDIVLLSTSAQGLRKHLETLEDYCSKWNLQINEAKTKVSVFGTN